MIKSVLHDFFSEPITSVVPSNLRNIPTSTFPVYSRISKFVSRENDLYVLKYKDIGRDWVDYVEEYLGKKVSVYYLDEVIYPCYQTEEGLNTGDTVHLFISQKLPAKNIDLDSFSYKVKADSIFTGTLSDYTDYETIKMFKDMGIICDESNLLILEKNKRPSIDLFRLLIPVVISIVIFVLSIKLFITFHHKFVR